MSLRTLNLGPITGSTTEDLTTFKVPHIPVTRNPQIYIEIYDPAKEKDLAQTISSVVSSINTSPSSAGLFSSVVQSIKNNTRSTLASVRLIATGKVSNQYVIDNSVEVNIQIKKTRMQTTDKTILTIYNPSDDRLEVLVPGNIVQIKMGYTGGEVLPVFVGYIESAEDDWIGDDYTVTMVCEEYVQSIVNTIPVKSLFLGEDNTVDDLQPIVITNSNPNNIPYRFNVDTSYEEGFKTLVTIINILIVEKYGISLSIDPRFEQLNLFPEPDDRLISFIPPNINNDSTTIAFMLDAYLYQMTRNDVANGNLNINWWLNGPEITFVLVGAVENPPGHLLTIGEDTMSVKGNKGVVATPKYADSLSENTDKPVLFDIKKVARFLDVKAMGLNTVNVGHKVIIQRSPGTPEDKRLKSLLYNDVTNSRTWVVDSLEHRFSIEGGYVTHLTLSPFVSVDSNNRLEAGLLSTQRLLTVKERKRLQFQDTINRSISRRMQIFNGILLEGSMYKQPSSSSYDTDTYNAVDTDNQDTDGVTRSNAGTQISVLKSFNDNLTQLPENTTFSSQIVDANKIIASVTSPWANSYIDTLPSGNRKHRPSGIWHPKYPQVGVNRNILNSTYRHIIHVVGKQAFLGMSDWSRGVAPLCYVTDYMIKTPTRSVFLMPTDNIPDREQDAGSATLIANQIHFDANPLTSGNVRGILHRPNIKGMVGKKQHADSPSAEDDEFVITVTNGVRSKASKIIVKNADKEGFSPEIHVILDDSLAEGSRTELVMTSNGTESIAYLINKQMAVVLDSEDGEIGLFFDKSTVNDKFVKIDNTKVTIKHTELRVEGNINATGVITGGAT